MSTNCADCPADTAGLIMQYRHTRYSVLRKVSGRWVAPFTRIPQLRLT